VDSIYLSNSTNLINKPEERRSQLRLRLEEKNGVNQRKMLTERL